MPHKFSPNPSMRNLLFVLLLLGAASGLGYLAMHHHIQRDVTYNASNSLEPGSVDVLRQLSGPVTITVYATEQDARLGLSLIHISEPTRLGMISYAVFCLKK